MRFSDGIMTLRSHVPVFWPCFCRGSQTMLVLMAMQHLLNFLDFCVQYFVEQFNLRMLLFFIFDLCDNSGQQLCGNHCEKWGWTCSVTPKTLIIVRIYVSKSHSSDMFWFSSPFSFYFYVLIHEISEVAISCTLILTVDILSLTNLQSELKKYNFFLRNCL